MHLAPLLVKHLMRATLEARARGTSRSSLISLEATEEERVHALTEKRHHALIRRCSTGDAAAVELVFAKN